MEKNPFDLTDKQKAAFNKLKQAYRACEKAGIYFINCYGSLEAYNAKFIENYSDDSSLDENDENVVNTHDYSARNYFTIVNEWTDDKHLIKLTPAGKKALDDYNYF